MALTSGPCVRIYSDVDTIGCILTMQKNLQSDTNF